MNAPGERALFIGRFQPFHLGHLEAVRTIRTKRPSECLLLGIGSAQESFTVQNPFTAGERFDMIDRSLREAEIDGVQIIPLVDINQHAVWVAYVVGLLPAFHRVYTNNPLTRTLFEGAGYPVEGTPLYERERWVGVDVRAALARGEPMEARVPPAVARFLREIHGVERLKMLSRRQSDRRESLP